MAFLTKEELKTKTTVEIIDLITNSDNGTITDIIDENIDVMKSYLFKYYNTDAIFNSEGNSKSKVVLKHLKSLVISDVFEIRQKSLSQTAEKKYDEAMRWLELMSKGTIEADLPAKALDTDGDGETDTNQSFMRLGSKKAYKNHF